MPDVAEPIQIKPIETPKDEGNKSPSGQSVESLRAQLARAEARTQSGVNPMTGGLSQTSDDLPLSAVEPGIIHGLRTGQFSREQYPHIADMLDEAEGVNA